MKNLFKLFPVALAAFAMASCSSDDLNIANGEAELIFSPDKLLVQIEGDGSDEATRGGYVTNIYNYNLYSAMAFAQDDQLKVYHNATSWKPEIWAAKEYGQYKNAEGIAVFEGTAADGSDAKILESEDAYGIYPSTASVFGNENRTSIQYDLTEMAWVDYSVDATKTYAGTTGDDAITKFYQAEFPLWGVKAAGSKVMTMKHLCGILRLDVAKIDVPTAANTYNYVVIYSPTQKLTGKIATAADLLAPTTSEQLDPTKFMTSTPALSVEAAANPLTALNSVPLTEAAVKAYDNLIVIAIDKNTTDTHLMAFVPILPGIAGADNVQVFVTGVQPANATSVDLSSATPYMLSADVISECNNNYTIGGTQPYAGETTVQRGVTYKINDDATNQNTTAKTPWELAKGIIEADKAAYRDFEITFTQPIEVKNTDTAPQNFYLDLSGENTAYGLAGWDLKHNVTAHIKLAKSGDVGTGKAKLYIKTGTDAGKKLTLDITNESGKEIDYIEFVDGELKSEVELKETTGALCDIIVGTNTADKLTIGSGLASGKSIKTKSNIIIDAPVANSVQTVTLATGATGLKLNNGTISTLNIDATEKIAADVTIESTGTSQITAVELTNIPEYTTGRDKFGLYFTSTWNGESSKTGITEQVNIYTVAQLAAVTGSTGDYKLMGDMDLSANAAWASLALAKKFEGQNKNNGVYTSSTVAKEVVYPAIKGLTQPLFGTVNNAVEIKNFKLEDANIKATYDNVGILAKYVPANGAITIDNVDVKDGTIDASGYNNVGGLIGRLNGNTDDQKVIIENCDINGLSITGHKALGGLVGWVNRNHTNTATMIIGSSTATASAAGNTNLCTVEDVTFTITETPNVIYDPEYKSVGLFIGQITRPVSSDIIIKIRSILNEMTVNGEDAAGKSFYTDKGKYGIGSGTVVYYDVVNNNQKLIGYSGYYTANAATIWTKNTNNDNYSATVWKTSITSVADDSNYLYYINK